MPNAAKFQGRGNPVLEVFDHPIAGIVGGAEVAAEHRLHVACVLHHERLIEPHLAADLLALLGGDVGIAARDWIARQQIAHPKGDHTDPGEHDQADADAPGDVDRQERQSHGSRRR